MNYPLKEWKPMSTSYLSALAGGNWLSQGLIGLKVNFIIRTTPDGQARQVKSSQVVNLPICA